MILSGWVVVAPSIFLAAVDARRGIRPLPDAGEL
jgi:hypothetical protein